MSDDPRSGTASHLSALSTPSDFTVAAADPTLDEASKTTLVRVEPFDVDVRNRLFSENVAAKIWKVAQNFLRSNVSFVCYSRCIESSSMSTVDIRIERLVFGVVAPKWRQNCTITRACVHSIVTKTCITL